MKLLNSIISSLIADLVLALFFMIVWNLSLGEAFKPITYWQSFSIFILADFVRLSFRISDKLSED